ncbi:MAG: undecaprenyl-phosphate glucose phosphotransferase [Rhodospirillales bacterium]|nr:undecaprenyl-phosphate glucose phosphotransferase [Rhodospirillales bacterium]
MIIASAMLGGVTYWITIHGSFGDVGAHAGIGLISSVVFALAFHQLGSGGLHNFLREQQSNLRLLAAWALVVPTVTALLFLFKFGEQVSRGSIIVFVVLGAGGLFLWRNAARRFLRSAMRNGTIRGRQVIVIGTEAELARFSRQSLLMDYGLAESERLALPNRADNPFSPSEAEVVRDAIERTRTEPLKEVILALPWSDLARIEQVLNQLRVSPLPVRLLPDRATASLLDRQSRPFASLTTIEIQRAPLTLVERFVKRVLDIVAASVLLVMLAPLMALVAIAIKLETRGPVIFRQRRHGFNGRQFVIWKFRTMTVMDDGPVIVQATKGDPRVTRVGGILRQTSIDELPQLFNVLTGCMSVVGPRPHPVALDNKYGALIANYAYRHHVKPGITGWAQVNGYRGETPRVELMEKRIALDLWYIANWSFWLDIQIMFRTFFELLHPRNVY